jgi:hypothetical protein
VKERCIVQHRPSIFRVYTRASDSKRKRFRAGSERYAQFSSHDQPTVWLIIISVLVLGKVLQKLLSLSSVGQEEQSSQDKQDSDAWQVVRPVRLCYSFPWGRFSPSLLINMLSVSPVLPGSQGGCRVNAQSKNRYKGGGRNAKFSPAFN